jgi:hypothetical protein
MTDFLSNLAARSFGAVGLIRPRVASFFEPVQKDAASVRKVVAGGPEETGLSTEIEDEGSQKRVNERHPAQVPPRNSAYGSDVVRNEDARTPAAIIPPPQNGRDLHVASVLTERTAERDRPLLIPSLHARGDLAPEAGDSDREQSRVAMRPELGTTVTHPSGTSPIVSSKRQQAVANNERGLLIPPKLPQELRISDMALGATYSSQRRERTQSFPSEVSPQSEPSIQVTIGRIDVRATKENERPARPASASPVMSLDEYLRRRAVRGGQ